MDREAAEKPPVTSYLFHSSFYSEMVELLFQLRLTTSVSICPQSSKTSMVNFGQLVASSAP